MEENLNGRVGVVTGASAGIGLAVAKDLAQRGCRLVLNARRADRLRAIADEINEHAGEKRAEIFAGDAGEATTNDGLLNHAEEVFNAGVDLVVVNAGRGLGGSVVTSDESQWDEMVRTNLLGAAMLMRRAAVRMRVMVELGSWRAHPHDIVVLGSNVGRHISPFSSMYGSTKFAVNSLAEAMRRELAPAGIRVTLVEPGFVATEFQGVAGYDPEWFTEVVDRIGPVLSADDVARMIGFAVSQPPHVHISDVLIRPTRQDYP